MGSDMSVSHVSVGISSSQDASGLSSTSGMDPVSTPHAVIDKLKIINNARNIALPPIGN